MLYQLLVLMFLLSGLVACQQKSEIPPEVLSQEVSCQPSIESCRLDFVGGQLSWRTTSSIQYLKPFAIELHLEGIDAVQTIMMRFSMKGMDMGVNHYVLQRLNASTWQAEVVLPVCVSGRRDWQAEVEIKTNSKIYTANFLFSVGEI